MKKILIILVLVCCANNHYAQNKIVYNDIDNNDSIFIIKKIYNDTTISYELKYNFYRNNKQNQIKYVKNANPNIEYDIKDNYQSQWENSIIFKVNIYKYSLNFNSKIELNFENNTSKMIYFFYNPENKLILGKLNHDFCMVKQGEIVEHTFKLKNISKDTITILNNEIEDNILTKFSKRPILPNQSFDFTIVFRSEAKDGYYGKIKKINFSNGVSIDCEYQAYVYVLKYPIIEPLYQFDSMVTGMKTYDFGYIKEGSNVSFNYVFKNISNDTLYIENISTECGCHYCNWSREPIFPNQYFIVGNHFNASGKNGVQSKIANMTISNHKGYNNSIIINFTAFVEYCKEEAIYIYPTLIRKK